MTDQLVDLIIKRFIARGDVKAIQRSDGAWNPVTDTGKRDGKYIPWTREDIVAHLENKRTFGHYLLNQQSQCKLFAFDIDLKENKEKEPDEFQGYWYDKDADEVREFNPRIDWQNRAHPSRTWVKYQMKMLASILMKGIYDLDNSVNCAAAYSGSKGVHVYGFTGLMDAEEAREGAEIILESTGVFAPSKGKVFWEHTDKDPVTGFPNFSIEVFPKQTHIEEDKLGNLMRLCLGRNLKNPSDPTFFIDFRRSPMSVMAPADPLWALTTSDPWGDS